jgi:hypothetical protein
MNAIRRLCLIVVAAFAANLLFHSPSFAQSGSSNGQYYYVGDTRPPDAFLALRTEPSGSIGQRIMQMPNGTLLDVLQRRADGWWYVRVVANGATGWALSQHGDRVWIYCCSSDNTTAADAPHTGGLKTIAMSANDLRRYGMALGWDFPNRCPSKEYDYYSKSFEDRFQLSISDAMLDHFKARGFSLEALCLALLSPIRFDSETGKQLPLASIEGHDLQALNVPDCFKNGTPFLDCTLNYLWLDREVFNADDQKNFQRLRAFHSKIYQRLAQERAGNWYYGGGLGGLFEGRGPWEVYFEAFQLSPNLPRGYGYMLHGLEGADPALEKVDLQTIRKESGSSAPWDQQH